MPNVVMLSVVILSVVMNSVFMLNVIMLSVMAPRMEALSLDKKNTLAYFVTKKKFTETDPRMILSSGSTLPS
jgi:hypothetical protein